MKQIVNRRKKYNDTIPDAWRFALIFMCCSSLLVAFLAAPVVHKHCPTHTADVKDYDTSCYWVKTVKLHRFNNCAFDPLLYVLSLLCLLSVSLIFLYTLDDLIAYQHNEAPARLITTRGPPAIIC
jgi:hypothetical protein